MTSRTRVPVSVCMATYNGALYLREQLTSIVEELGPDDEVIVLDDGSSDATLDILGEYRDPRITVLENPSRLGPAQTFNRAMSLARHDVILLADQDDVWLPGRVTALVQELDATGALLVSSNSIFVDSDLNPTSFPMPPLEEASSSHNVRNIVRIFAGRACYYGCTMAVSAELRNMALPVPRYAESHDLWLAMAANLCGRNAHLEEPTIKRRIHGTNASVINRPLWRKLLARLKFGTGMMHLMLRISRWRWFGGASAAAGPRGRHRSAHHPSISTKGAPPSGLDDPHARSSDPGRGNE